MLNRGSWASGKELCYKYACHDFDEFYCLTRLFFSYAHLLPEDAPRFLGCRVPYIDAWASIQLNRVETPIPLHSLASQAELYTWLTRVLFSILVPGTPSLNKMARIDYPNNIVAFIDLLIHLHGVGFPSHWLSSFLSIILRDALFTDVTPYLGEFPVPSSERTRRVAKRKVNLAPWHSDFENVLAVAWQGLPFPIVPMTEFARSPEDLLLLQVDTSGSFFTLPETPHVLSTNIPVMSLLFFRPRLTGLSVDQLAENVHQILEGKMGADNGNMVHILTVVDKFDYIRGVIRWKMSKERVKMMKAEDGWVMAPYRFDERLSGECFVFFPRSRAESFVYHSVHEDLLLEHVERSTIEYYLPNRDRSECTYIFPPTARADGRDRSLSLAVTDSESTTTGCTVFLSISEP